jgi:type 1 glutamine amidotransferase
VHVIASHRSVLPLALTLLSLSLANRDASAQERLPRGLFLTHSAGYQHGVVTRPAPDRLSVAEAGLLAAARGRFELTATQDCADLTPELLADLDLVIFYTTGELPLAPGMLDALLSWVREGGAFVGIHCASDTFYKRPEFLDMVGGTFDGHPWHQEVTLRVEDGDHLSTRHLGESWTLTDEIYQFRGFQRHPAAVLLSLTAAGVDLDKGKRADRDYANAWCKPYGRGRVFYTALGHRPKLWTDPVFTDHVLGGMQWAVQGPDHGVVAPVADGGKYDLSQTSAWTHRGGEDFAWSVEGEVMVGAPGAGDLVSRETFGDALMHVEFAVPEGGNSGVYVQGRYEIQIYQTFGQALVKNSCGALYNIAAPARDAMRRPTRWQSFDIRFVAPRFDADGKRSAMARISVWHNGMLIHDDVPLSGPTPGGLGGDEVASGRLMLQDHGHPVRFRNVWISPLSD